MKFLVLSKQTPDNEGKFPDESLIMEGMKLHEEMVKAGVLLDAGGLWPSTQGKRIRVKGEKREITDGPFTESKELIGGYWIMDAASMDEVVKWMDRFPLDKMVDEVEIRRLYDVGEFDMSDEAHAKHAELEKQVKR